MCIPEELDDQGGVNENVVTGYHNLPSCLPGEQCTYEIADISSTPDDKEKNGQS
jgi:hypothetical protein